MLKLKLKRLKKQLRDKSDKLKNLTLIKFYVIA